MNQMNQRKIAAQKIFLFIFTVLCITVFVPHGTAYAAMLSNESILSAGDGAETDVCISGDYAIAGAPFETVDGLSNAGKAYIYHWNGTSWEQQQVLSASDKAQGTYFGQSVSISGDYVIVGSSYAANGAGEAYIFHWNGTNWEQQQILTASDKATGDYFGWSVSISGDYAIVGAYSASSDETVHNGQAYIFYRNGTSWEQQQILSGSKTASAYFGYTVSISGDYAIVGASGENNASGYAYIFYRSGSSWTQQQILSASDKAANANFGYSVSISGDYAIVGAYWASSGGVSNAGQAYIFCRSGSSWTEQQILSASDKAASADFGWSVAISGDYAIVGAPMATVGGLSQAGKAYIYHWNETSWDEQQILKDSVHGGSEQFGFDGYLSGDRAIVCQYAGSPSGVFFYELVDNIVTYNASSGSGMMATSGGTPGAIITLRENKFTKTGYFFIGWSTTSGGAVEYTNGASYTLTASDVTLYAVWVDPEFSVLGATKHQNMRITDAAISGTTYHLIRGLNPLGETIDTVMDYFQTANITWVLSSYDASTGTYTTVSDASTDRLGNLFRMEVYNPDSTLLGTYYIVIMGDLNCDGVINNTDSVILANHTANVSAISGTMLLYSADTDGNEILSNTDTAAVRNQANGKVEIEQ